MATIGTTPPVGLNPARYVGSGSSPSLAPVPAPAAPTEPAYSIPTPVPAGGRNGAGGVVGETDGLTPEQADTQATLRATLAEFGLAGLADWVWNQYINGSPVERIFLDIRTTPEWQAEYGATIGELAKKGVAISEREVIALRRQFMQVAQSWDLPTGFFDSRDDFDSWIANLRSPVEFNDLAAEAAAAATEWASSPDGLTELAGRPVGPDEAASVAEEMQRLYSVGSLTAYYLDPQRTLALARRQTTAARIGVQARRSGFGQLTRSEADQLASQGITAEQAQRGFSGLEQNVELFTPLPGEAGQGIDRGGQLGAAFGGDVAAASDIEKRRRQRQGTFAGGGQFAGNRTGLGGLGSAQS